MFFLANVYQAVSTVTPSTTATFQTTETVKHDDDDVLDEDEHELEVPNEVSSNISTCSNNITTSTGAMNKQETALLLTLYGELSNNKLKYKKDIHQAISMKMKEHGYNFTTRQIKNRITALTTKYKEVKDHNNKSGNSNKEWKYFEIMSNFYGDRPNITPVAPCSSISLNVEASSNGTSLEVSTTSSKRAKPYTKVSARQNMLKWLDVYNKNNAEKEKNRLEIMERHHRENQDLLKKFLDVLKK
jgi:hypothetical protein